MITLKRSIKIVGDTVIIPLTKGMEAFCDLADAPLVSEFNWTASKAGARFYALRTVQHVGAKPESVRMHRLIMSPPTGLSVDHIDGNGLNNRRSNLRLATVSQNGCNRGPAVNNTSGYKGVWWFAYAKLWTAQIRLKGKRYHLGYFKTAEEAHSAYCAAASRIHGEFAYVSPRSETAAIDRKLGITQVRKAA